MDYEADPNQGGRLRLRRRVLWVPGSDDAAPYSQRLTWAVDGMAGGVSLNVDMGGFRSGGRENPAADHALGIEMLVDHWVEAALAPRGVYVHARRPWPVPEDHQDHYHDCPVIDGECWTHELVHERDPALHELMVRLVQPTGPTFVWERLEGIYREEFAPALSTLAYTQQQREEGARLAEATLRGAERARGAQFGPEERISAAEAVHKGAPFMLEGAAVDHEDTWVTVVKAEDNGEPEVLVWTDLPDDGAPWMLARHRTVRVRGPL